MPRLPNAAVNELDERLKSFGVIESPSFPSFVGTFDRFLWQFFIVPFGIDECDKPPRLVPDKNDWEIRPFPASHALKLSCFDRKTGLLIAEKAAKAGFKPRNGPSAWERRAQSVMNHALKEGRLDFEDVREFAKKLLPNEERSRRLGGALVGRFQEVIVDEAQDCNPADLQIVDFLRASGLRTKVVCDPNQAIYSFRGGVTDEIIRYEARFEIEDRLPLSGNFRSSPSICAAISQLRPPATRGSPDIPLGPYKNIHAAIYLIRYAGNAVSAAIGERFQAIAADFDIQPTSARVLASTWETAGNAVSARGRPSCAGAMSDEELVT